MCTVTIIKWKDGIRLACNRDESPLRPAALPPRLIACGGHQTLMPIDPVGGGTWIAANDAGLVATLLNAYEGPRDKFAPPAKMSRGAIIPMLMKCSTLAEAHAQLCQLERSAFAGFRLVLATRDMWADLYAPGPFVAFTPPSPFSAPLLFTSSGLGDGIVGPPRRQLFEEAFRPGPVTREIQDRFHRHFWPDRRHLSVCMRRDDARTVSYTIVELGADCAVMTYHPSAPDEAIESIRSSLDVTLQHK